MRIAKRRTSGHSACGYVATEQTNFWKQSQALLWRIVVSFQEDCRLTCDREVDWPAVSGSREMTVGTASKSASLLYKYVNIEVLRHILDGQIRFTQPSAFNDPFELLPEII